MAKKKLDAATALKINEDRGKIKEVIEMLESKIVTAARMNDVYLSTTLADESTRIAIFEEFKTRNFNVVRKDNEIHIIWDKKQYNKIMSTRVRASTTSGVGFKGIAG